MKLYLRRAIVLPLLSCILQIPAWSADAPYPPSPVIKGVEWAPPADIIRLADGSDNWPISWADDGNLYTAYGDGWGFEPKVPNKLSLGFAKVIGNPPDIHGENIRSKSGEQHGQGSAGKKASGMLMVDGVLYMLVRNADNSQLAWSNDHAKTWQWSEWKFEESFGAPTFLNFGKNYRGARDQYVYIYSQDHESAYENADQMVMARVHKDKIRDRDAYQFFKGLNKNNQPQWTNDINQCGAVFKHPGRCYRNGISYNAGLKRYIWCQTINTGGKGPRFEGGLGIYDAPEPWGPWTTVYFNDGWDVGPGETSSIPPKWISDDGETAHLVFSGDDHFSVRKLTFETRKSSMIFPGDTWDIASPDSQGVDSDQLKHAVTYLKEHSGRDGAEQLVIIRNGRMIHHGSNIDKVHGVWSLTKSFTSTVLGLLIDEGKTSLDSRAHEYLPSLAEHYPDVTLKHFATMTSGYRAIGDEPRGGYTHGPSSTPFDPNPVPRFTPPGSKYAYWDSAMNQFGNVLTRIAEEPIEAYLKRKMADPIGMNPDKWNWGDFGKVDGIEVNGGSGNSNNHIFICSQELARFGHLFLNNGNWNGQQLISKDWVNAVQQVQVPVSTPLGHKESGIDGRGVYGLNWWVNGINADGKHRWPDAPPKTYSASGYNNNDMFVIPEWDMVIVRLGLDQGSDGAISTNTYSTFIGMIGDALQY